MLPFSSRKPSGYNMLKTDDSDRNQQNFCSDFFESASSSFKTPEKDISNKTFTVQNKGVNGFGSASSGYSSMSPSYSPCSSPFSIYEDSEISRSFDSLLLPIQSYKKRHADIFLSSTPLPAAYSPLSSFQFAKTSSVFDSDFDFGKKKMESNTLIILIILSFRLDLLGESQESQSHLKEVQRDFEMNGVTKEMDGSFIPMAASTPLVPRRYPQYNLSYYQPQMQQKPTEMQRQPMPEQTSVGYTQTVLPKKRFKPNKKSLIDVSG